MMGILYEILPNAREPFMLWYGVAHSYTEHFVPPSMQFNSLQLSDNNKIISAISWINKNTQPNAIIIGEKHWRGQLSDNNKIISAISWINKNTQPNTIIIGEKHWRGFMELYLHDHRTFRFSDDLPALASGLIKHRLDGPVYLIQYSDTRNNNSNIYSNSLFSINKIR